MANPMASKQVCVITVMFPVDDDGEALRIKKEIETLVKHIEQARIDFRLGNAHGGT